MNGSIYHMDVFRKVALIRKQNHLKSYDKIRYNVSHQTKDKNINHSVTGIHYWVILNKTKQSTFRR